MKMSKLFIQESTWKSKKDSWRPHMSPSAVIPILLACGVCHKQPAAFRIHSWSALPRWSPLIESRNENPTRTRFLLERIDKVMHSIYSCKDCSVTKYTYSIEHSPIHRLRRQHFSRSSSKGNGRLSCRCQGSQRASTSSKWASISQLSVKGQLLSLNSALSSSLLVCEEIKKLTLWMFTWQEALCSNRHCVVQR